MSVCKMLFFFLNLRKKCWLAPGRVLASSEKNAFCQCHLTFLCLFAESTKLLNPFLLAALSPQAFLSE